jgi:hypothetical protein
MAAYRMACNSMSTTGVGALQFDDYQLTLLAEREQVDTAPRVFPVTVFLRDHQQVITEHRDVIA